MKLLSTFPKLPGCFRDGCVLLVSESDQAMVWLLHSDQVSDLQPYLAILPETLRQRHDRLRFDRDRHRLAARHVFLRYLLAHHLETAPDQVIVTVGSYGKPRLAGPVPALHFSQSQAGPLALLALAIHPVGVDLEKIERGRRWDQRSLQVFSPGELHDLRKRGTDLDEELFLRYWTAKEAILKVHGTGLQTPMAEIEVHVQEKGIDLRRLPTGFPERENWRLSDVPVSDRAVSSLAFCFKQEPST